MCYQHDYEAAQLLIDMNTIESDDREECYREVYMPVIDYDDDDSEDAMTHIHSGWIMI